MALYFLAAQLFSALLPVTGEQTDWLPYIIGGALIALAGVLIALRLYKRKDEDENDNSDGDLDR